MCCQTNHGSFLEVLLGMCIYFSNFSCFLQGARTFVHFGAELGLSSSITGPCTRRAIRHPTLSQSGLVIIGAFFEWIARVCADLD